MQLLRLGRGALVKAMLQMHAILEHAGDGRCPSLCARARVCVRACACVRVCLWRLSLACACMSVPAGACMECLRLCLRVCARGAGLTAANDCRHMLNRLYVTEYCAWVQSVSDAR